MNAPLRRDQQGPFQPVERALLIADTGPCRLVRIEKGLQ